MKITKTICDICKKEIIEKTWEDNPQKLSISIYNNSQNPLGFLDEKPGFQRAELFFQDVCQYCNDIIAKDIYDSIIKIRNKKNENRNKN